MNITWVHFAAKYFDRILSFGIEEYAQHHNSKSGGSDSTSNTAWGSPNKHQSAHKKQSRIRKFTYIHRS